MTLAFWNNGTPRVVRSRKRVVLPNGDIVLNATPNPQIDLYAYREIGHTKDPYRKLTGPIYENDGWTITATYTAGYVAIGQIREMRINQVKAEAGSRILRILPDWKQRNLTARAVELQDKGRANWTADELAEWESGDTVWTWVKAVRAASNEFEVAIAAEADAEAAASMQPAWPAPPAGFDQGASQ